MKNNRARKWMTGTALLLAANCCMTSCLDKSFDLDEDIDMTMGFGSDGLSVKLGTTEKILLGDILEVDKSVKLDNANTYYLVEEGSTAVDFKVNTFSTNITNASLSTTHRVVNFSDVLADMGIPSGLSVNVPAGYSLTNYGEGQTDKFAFTVKDIQADVKQVTTVYPKEGTCVTLSLRTRTSNNSDFKLTEVRDLEIKMPDYLKIKSVDKGSFTGHTVRIPLLSNPEGAPICKVEVDCIELGADGVVSNKHELSLPVEKTLVTMKGTFTFSTTNGFTMTEADYADVELALFIGTGTPGTVSNVEIAAVEGKFDPVIDPSLENIDIAGSLPDFLDDPEVFVDVANPTLKFKADLTNIPLSLNFTGDLTAHKGGANGFDKTVRLPKDGVASFLQGRDNLLYFCQTGSPYDPAGAEAGAGIYTVPTLSDLIEQLPDYISVDVSAPKVRVKQDETYHVTLGKNYHANLKYNIFVPFQFNAGLKIVYSDSTDNMNDDLKDYQAHGLKVTATAKSTIPLDLLATVTPVDINGQPIHGIHVSQATIPASDGEHESSSELTLDIKLDNPADLQLVDKLLFRVNADANANANGTSLKSTQYLQLEDVRIRLNGQVVGDFN